MDEPSLHLNNREKNDLIRILNFINEKYNKTIIIMSRDTDFVYKFNSNIFILNNGKIVMKGDNNIFYNEKELEKYNLYSPEIIQFSNIVKEKYNKNFKYYNDIKDLIKGVCNDVL